MSSTWLSDDTANRYIQTYFNKFIEISGNLVVHDASFVDISNSITLKNGAFIRFPDGSTLSSAIVPSGNIPTDISFANVDISQNLQVSNNITTGNINLTGNIVGVQNITFSDSSIQNTAFTPATTVSLNNLSVSGTVTLPTTSIQNTALQTNVVLTDAVQTLSNKIINSNGIVDVSNATFNNVTINGTFNLLSTVTFGNINISGTLDASAVIVDNLLDANTCVIQNDLTVKGNTYLNTLDWNATVIRVKPVTGITQGRPINLTQFVYVVSPLVPAVNDYLTGNPIAPGMTIYGAGGPRVSSVDTTKRLITFNGPFGTALPAATSGRQIYGYASSPTVIQTFNTLSAATNDVVIPTIANPDKPYVSSINITNRTITLAGASLTTVTGTTTTGVYDSTFRLISNAMPPAGTLFGSLASTQQIQEPLITPKYANILGTTPTTTPAAATVSGYAYSTTQLNVVVTTSVANGQFIRDSTLTTDYTKGATVQSFNATNNTITLENGTATKVGGAWNADGFIPANGTQIFTMNNTTPAINQFVEGTGVPAFNNRIKAYTASQYVFDISNTMTTSTNSIFFGYIDQSNRMVVANGTTLPTNNFLYNGAGLVATTNYYRVGSLASSNTYNITTGLPVATPASRTALTGISLNATTFLYSVATSPVLGDFIGHQPGSRVSGANLTTQTLTTTNLTPTAVSQTRLGYIVNSTTIQLDPSANMTGISAGQFITGTGVSLSRPYSASVNTTAKTVTMTTASLTPTATVDISGVIINSGGTRYFVTKTAISTATYFAGANVNSISRTVGDGSITKVSNTYTAIITPTLQATAYITGVYLYPISSTRIVYNPALPSPLLINNTFLVSKTESNNFGAYISATGGTITDCELTMTNSSIPALTPTNTYGRITKVLSTYYLYYQYQPANNAYLYNSNITTYNNGGFVISNIDGVYPRASIGYKSQLLVTETPILVSIPGYYSSTFKLLCGMSDANRTLINNNGVGASVDFSNNVATNRLLGPWVSAGIPSYSYELPVRNYLNVMPNFTPNSPKYYRVISWSRAQSDKVTTYVEKTSGSSPDLALGDFADFPFNSVYTTGAYISQINTYSDVSGTYYGVKLVNRLWTTVLTAGIQIDFYQAGTVNIYRRDAFDTYAPTVTNADAYNMSNYTTTSETTYSFYNPVTDWKYSGSSYQSFTPITFLAYNPQTYTLSTPQTITYFPTTLYSFYPGTPLTTFTSPRNISIPQITDVSGDTFCLLKEVQTLTNKTITAPTITTPTITNPTINTITLQTSTGQTSTQLGYLINKDLPGDTIVTANTWTQPSSSLGQITLPDAGVYLLTYSFTTRTGGNVLMGCLTLSSTAPSTTPQTTNPPATIFAFSAQTSPNANYITCTNTYVYVATASTTIYLWWAGSLGNTVIQANGNYFQAVRIA